MELGQNNVIDINKDLGKERALEFPPQLQNEQKSVG